MKELTTVGRANAAVMLKRQTLGRRFRKQVSLQTFVLLGMAFLLVFSFAPLFGIQMAFKDYTISSGIKGIFTSEWVGLRYFHEMTNDYMFPTLVRNTIHQLAEARYFVPRSYSSGDHD